MKAFYTLLLAGFSLTLHAQNLRANRHTPVTYFTLSDSTLVTGKIVRQDSALIIVQQHGGVLTYLQPNQVVRSSTQKPGRPNQAKTIGLTSFSLKDGATVSGQVVRETPMAVVVRQADGTLSYIDPSDILNTGTTTVADVRTDRTDEAIGASYLLSGRTAYTPRAGTVYYRNTYLIRNEAEVGITSGWSAGVITNPSWDDVYDASPYLYNAIYANTDFGTQVYTRASIPIGNSIRLGAVLTAQLQSRRYVGLTDSPAVRSAFLGQLMASFGKPHSNITLGYTFRLGDVLTGLQQPDRITIGTIQYLTRRLALVSDNAIVVKRDFSGSVARLSAALRIRGGFHTFDVGISSFVISNAFYNHYNGSPSYSFFLSYKAYPYLSYTVRFGGRR